MSWWVQRELLAVQDHVLGPCKVKLEFFAAECSEEQKYQFFLKEEAG